MHGNQSARTEKLQAFNHLVTAYQETVYNLAYRLLGDEEAAASAAQATFVRAYHIGPVVKGQEFELILLQILAQICRQSARGAGNPSRVASDDVQSGLLNLPFDLRLALVIVDCAGLDYRRAARVLETGMPDLRSRLALARRSLQLPTVL